MRTRLLIQSNADPFMGTIYTAHPWGFQNRHLGNVVDMVAEYAEGPVDLAVYVRDPLTESDADRLLSKLPDGSSVGILA